MIDYALLDIYEKPKGPVVQNDCDKVLKILTSH